MKRAMVRLFLSLGLLAVCALIVGCENDLPPQPSQVPGKLERGISGQGTLYQPDRSSDPVIREQSRVGY
jgi:hypothetical protein